MTATTTTPARTPFNYGEFYHAIVGLIGREPDVSMQHGLDGFYGFIYKPKDETEREWFERYAPVIRRLLDKYDITFSGSVCGYTREWIGSDGTAVLRIAITHPVTDETTKVAESLHCNVD